MLEDQGVRIELDAQPDQLTLYLRDAEVPMSTRGATAQIILLNGVDITDAYLDPTPEQDRFTVSGRYRLIRGSTLVTRVNLPDGRRLNVRFLIII